MSKITKKDVVVITPAYNEEKYIVKVLRKLNKSGFAYVVVDDGSTDKTFDLAKKIAPYTLRHRVNLGKGAALRTGCKYAFENLNAKAVIFMDSDDQHSVEELDLFLKSLKKGNQLIFGVRSFDNTMPLIKIIGNRLASYLILLFFGKYIPDVPSGYKAMTKSVYRKLNLTSSNYGIELEVAVKTAKFRLKHGTIPIETIYHDADKGFQFLDAIKLVLNLISWRIQLI